MNLTSKLKKLTSEDEIEQSYNDSRDLRNVIEKQKRIEKYSNASKKELEENVLMLENNVKHKDIEVLKLEQDHKSFAASTSVDNAKLCEHCSSDSESNLTMHTGNFLRKY